MKLRLGKKAAAIAMAAMMVVLAGCSGGNTTTTAAGGAADGTTAAGTEAGGSTAADATGAQAASDYKIAIIYTDSSQGEEPVRAYENLKAEYGDKIVGAVLPNKEPEAIMSTALSLVSDESVKALLIFQEQDGCAAAVKACKEVRPDVWYACGVVAEDPAVSAAAFDVILNPNQTGMGNTIIEQAKAMGATTFVHYSFPRHMAMELLANRRDIMKAKCEELGIKFVEETSPDPMGDAGVTGTQQFILEDIPKKVTEYGKDTAFFGTNTAMMDVIVKATVESGAMLPSTCDPSPFQGFISGLGIQIPDDKSNDAQYAVEQIKAKMAELGMTGRTATWPVASSALYFYAIYDYACAYAEGTITEKTDIKAMTDLIDKRADEMAGMDVNVYLTEWENNGTTYPQYFAFLMDFVTL